jgi:PmbA protein
MDILERLRGQSQQVEVASVKDEATLVEFEANRLKASKVEETRGTAVRVIVHKRLGFAASTDETAVERLAVHVLESAAHGDKVDLAFPPAEPAPRVAAFDSRIAEMPIDRLVQMGQEIIDLLLEIEPDLRLNVSLRRSVQHLAVRNQGGADIAFTRTPLSLTIEATRIEGDDVLILESLAGWTTWEDDYLSEARRMGEDLVRARRLTRVATGEMPVLFAPTGAMVLALPLQAGLNGKNAYKGVSPMAGRLGERLFDEAITLVDDGTLDGRFASAPYDDEGVPHRRHALIKDGILQAFFYDLKTAAQAGASSTGNGSRELFRPPQPAPANLMLTAGAASLDDILRSIPEGLLVQDILGLGQGNILSGAFSNPLSLAFKIEGGEITGRVKNVSVAGNVYELLKEVAAVSREQEWVARSYCLPYVLLPRVSVVAQR